jgi:hypothetical protein
MRLHLQSVVTGAIASAAVALLFAEINAPAATAIDPASAFRGSLGASLGDLSLSDDVGRLSLLLNGGFALLFGAFASVAVAGLVAIESTGVSIKATTTLVRRCI